jgi:hypothetical protein
MTIKGLMITKKELRYLSITNDYLKIVLLNRLTIYPQERIFMNYLENLTRVHQ